MVVLNSMLRWLKNVPRRILIILVRAYQVLLSPLSPGVCRYIPSCSQYAIEALDKYGAIKGCILVAWRLLRCHPWGSRGYDPPRWFTEPKIKDS